MIYNLLNIKTKKIVAYTIISGNDSDILTNKEILDSRLECGIDEGYISDNYYKWIKGKEKKGFYYKEDKTLMKNSKLRLILLMEFWLPSIRKSKMHLILYIRRKRRDRKKHQQDRRKNATYYLKLLVYAD